MTNTPGEMSKQEPCGIVGQREKQQAGRQAKVRSLVLSVRHVSPTFLLLPPYIDTEIVTASVGKRPGIPGLPVTSAFDVLFLLLTCSCDLELAEQ